MVTGATSRKRNKRRRRKRSRRGTTSETSAILTSLRSQLHKSQKKRSLTIKKMISVTSMSLYKQRLPSQLPKKKTTSATLAISVSLLHSNLQKKRKEAMTGAILEEKTQRKRTMRKALAIGELMCRMQLKRSQRLLKRRIKMTLETLTNLKQLQLKPQKLKSLPMTGATSTNLQARNQQK